MINMLLQGVASCWQAIKHERRRSSKEQDQIDTDDATATAKKVPSAWDGDMLEPDKAVVELLE
jgi:hypothetical protein